MRFLLRLIINGLAIWFTAFLLNGVELTEADDGWGTVLVVAVVALVFTLVNLVVKPIVRIFALPLTILTLGLFRLVINALMVLLTSWITEFTDFGLHVDGFWWALLAGIVIGIAVWLIELIIPERHRR
ncbi:MAG TPA: phage holin family protein [Actinomycetaceae bacterium]|nr:phage holin family protein [Actinomycetaceae bacterium]